MSTHKSTTKHESKECLEGPRNASQFDSILESFSVDNDADDEETVDTSSLRHGTNSRGCEDGFYNLCWTPPSVPEYKIQHNKRKVESLQAEINHLRLQNTRLRQRNQILDKNMVRMGSTNDATLQTLQRRCATAEATSANLSREIEKIVREDDALKQRNKHLEGQLESLQKRLQCDHEITLDHRTDHCARDNLEQDMPTNEKLQDSLNADESEVSESNSVEINSLKKNKDFSLACDKHAFMQTHDGGQQEDASSYGTEMDTQTKLLEQNFGNHGSARDVQQHERNNSSDQTVQQLKEMVNKYCHIEQQLSAANLKIEILAKDKEMILQEHNIAINDLVDRYEDEHKKLLEWHDHEKQRWTSQYQDELQRLKNIFESEKADLARAHNIELQNVLKSCEPCSIKINGNTNCRKESVDRPHEDCESESNDGNNDSRPENGGKKQRQEKLNCSLVHGPNGNLAGLTRSKFHQIKNEANVDRCNDVDRYNDQACEIDQKQHREHKKSISHHYFVADDGSDVTSTDLSLSDDENGGRRPGKTKVMQASTQEFEIVLEDRQIHLLALDRWTSKLEAQMEETRSQMEVLRSIDVMMIRDDNSQLDPKLLLASEKETAKTKQSSALIQQHVQETSHAKDFDSMETSKRKSSVEKSDSSSSTKNTNDTLRYTSSDDECNSSEQDAVILALSKRLHEQDKSITALRRDIQQLRRHWKSISSNEHTMTEEMICDDVCVEDTEDKTNGPDRPEQQRNERVEDNEDKSNGLDHPEQQRNEHVDHVLKRAGGGMPEMRLDDGIWRHNFDLAQNEKNIILDEKVQGYGADDSLSEAGDKPNAPLSEMVRLEQQMEKLLLKINSLENDLVLERTLKEETEKRLQNELQKEQQRQSYNISTLEARLHKSEKDRLSLENQIDRLQKELQGTRALQVDGIDRQAIVLKDDEKVVEDASLVTELDVDKDIGKLCHEIQVLRRQLKAQKLGWEDARMTIRELEKTVKEREVQNDIVRTNLLAEIESLTFQLEELRDKLDLEQLEQEIISDFQDNVSKCNENDISYMTSDETETTTKDSSLNCSRDSTMCHEQDLDYQSDQLKMAHEEIANLRHHLKVAMERRDTEIFALEQQVVLLSSNSNGNSNNSSSKSQEKSSRIFSRVGKPRRISIWKPL